MSGESGVCDGSGRWLGGNGGGGAYVGSIGHSPSSKGVNVPIGGWMDVGKKRKWGIEDRRGGYSLGLSASGWQRRASSSVALGGDTWLRTAETHQSGISVELWATEAEVGKRVWAGGSGPLRPQMDGSGEVQWTEVEKVIRRRWKVGQGMVSWSLGPRGAAGGGREGVGWRIVEDFGLIRKLNVAADDDLGKTIEGGIVSGLQSKVWVQFEKYEDFCNALKLLCGRSMQKQGSRLKADYEVIWDKDDVFRSTQQIPPRIHVQERLGPRHEDRGQTQVEAPRVKSQITSGNNDRVGPKRWRD
ncbi:hypothetical protein QJS10_CPB13g00537 [Acorus calamus]|uniref:DUF4283 domain-containing protein n=1 Tax=Acorus calamus TaxID=4465 RepID=A0AAV9DI41_ACOCL|nr:hypothetical protein QJS10_CPB13g00537 [Acorus calamus]